MTKNFNEFYEIKYLLINFITRFLTLFLSVFTYLLFNSLLPPNIFYRSEIIVIIDIMITVFIFLKIQDYLINWFYKIFFSDYVSYDPILSRLANKKINYENLIKNIFPEIVKISESKYGILIILDEDSKKYKKYYFRLGDKKKIFKAEFVEFKERFILFLKVKKTSFLIGENSEEFVNEIFNQFNVEYIQPFVYREKVFGFLALSHLPGSKIRTQLEMICSRATIAIHNQILSKHFAEGNKYKKEKEGAEKIQKVIGSVEIPKFKNTNLTLNLTDGSVFFDIYQASEEIYYFVILNFNFITPVSTLIFSHITGKLFALNEMKLLKNLAQLKEAIAEEFNLLNWREKYNLIVGSFYNNKDEVRYQIIGRNIKVYRGSNENINLASIGWENREKINSDPICFSIKKNEIIKLFLKEK